MFAKQNRGAIARYSIRCALQSLLALAIAIGGISGQVVAQKYKSIEPRLSTKEGKALRSKVNTALRNPSNYNAGGSADIDKYFKQYYFPRRTQWNPGALAELGKKREEMVKLLRGTTVPKAQEQLTTLTQGVMKVLVRDNFHPAVRYNATLILGLLDEKYPSSGANASAPVVLSAGTNELLELLENEEFNGVKVHPSVKVGALEGLERHVQFGMDAQYAERVTKAALAVMGQDAKAIEVDADVNNWMKCQAARVLAYQYKDGPTQEIQAALTALIANEKMDLEDRCCVTGLLDKMKYTAGAQADITATILPLGKLTKAVVDEGAEVAREYEELILGNAPTTRRPRNIGGGRDDSGPKVERRELLSRLVLIDRGAKALSDGLADAEKQKVDSLTALLEPVISQSKDSKAFDVDIIREVYKLESSVENLVASWQPAAAAAPATDEVDFAE